MSGLKEKLGKKIEEWRPRTTKLLKDHGDVKVGEVTISQVIGGARGVKCLTTDISYLDPFEGIRFRGFTIPEVMEKLPKVPGQEMPYVEGFFYLLLTGELPTEKDAKEVAEEFKKRSKVPEYVFNILRQMPKNSHPMAMFSSAIVSMQSESVFVKEYNAGLNKMEYWAATYEDGLNLLARLPEIAAFIYRLKYKNGDIIKSDPKLDLGGNFAHMMGIKKPYDDVSRMYFILHSDHESGNVSAHTGHLVASALSDVYYAISAMINGLAGPLHGLANEEVLRWTQGVFEKMGGKIPTEEEMKKFVWDTLNSGQVIPGFGHAVLRKTDPRYMAQREFCLKHLPDDPLFKYVDVIYKVTPPILQEQGKAKNPWPNVDAGSGALLYHYGLKEFPYYTVLFSVSRAMGMCSQLIVNRAMGTPIERPKSVPTPWIKNFVKAK